MGEYLAVGLGEVLWDVLPEGRKLGGAPANFAFHVNGLGGRGVLISQVGDDDLGREALALLEKNGLDTACVNLSRAYPTGTVLARVDAQGVASYEFPDDVAWDYLELNAAARAAASEARAVCFGSLAQRSPVSRRAIRDFLRATPDGCLRLYDVNLRADFFDQDLVARSLDLADALKVSDEELPVLAGYFGLRGDDRDVLAGLCARFGLRFVALTRGAHGSLLVGGPGQAAGELAGQVSDHPGLTTEVRDTIGAGDSFTAALALGVLHGWSLDAVNQRANQVAAYVCSQPGAMAQVPEELRIS